MADLGRIVAGAVGGIADYGLDQLKSRQDEEREVRKAKLLEDLRAQTAERLATFEDNLRRKQGDKSFSAAEGNSFVIRNNRGEEVNRRALTEEEKRMRDLGIKKEELGITNLESQIASRARDDARQDRVATASIAASNRAGSSANDPSSISNTSIANELFYRYKDEVEETVKSGNISQSALRAAAIDIAANSRTGEDAESSFLTFLNNYRTGRKKTDQAKRSLDE